MDKVGISASKINKIITTHQDMDHIGCLPELLRLADNKVEVLTHEGEKPYIQGNKPFIRMNPEKMAKMLAALPEDQRREVEKMIKEVKPYEKTKLIRQLITEKSYRTVEVLR